jgi:L-threonylcarbamoyladenylate synthase
MVALKTQVVAVDPHEPDPAVVARAAEALRGGALVVLPTDTVYGLVADPRLSEAVGRIYHVKRRDRREPLALLLHDMSQATHYVDHLPESAVLAMQQFWPGALTVVLKSRLPATEVVRAKGDTVGLRLPAHVVPRLVAEQLGSALASTSANRSGRPAPVTAEEALAELDGLVELVLDGGPTPHAQESSVLTFAAQPPRALRLGAVSLARLREVLGSVEEG